MQIVIVVIAIALLIWFLINTWLALIVTALVVGVASAYISFENGKRRDQRRPQISNSILWLLAVPVFLVTLGLQHQHSEQSPGAQANVRATRQKGWDHRALPSARLAARAAGGFTNSDVHAYSNGLNHIRNLHQHLGSFTIAQVVDQENARASTRADAKAQQIAQAKDSERKRAQEVSEQQERNMYASVNAALVDSNGNGFYKGVQKIDGHPVVIMNGDTYYGETDQYASSAELRLKISHFAEQSWEKYGGNANDLRFRVDCVMAACAASRAKHWGL